MSLIVIGSLLLTFVISFAYSLGKRNGERSTCDTLLGTNYSKKRGF